MLSSRRLMSRSAESDAPMALSCSRRRPRSSPASAAASSRIPWVLSADVPLMGARAPRSLDADRTHFLERGHAREALFHAVLLQGPHALLQRHGKHLRHARLLGDELLQRVGGDQQLVQAAASLVAAAAAFVAADGLVERELPLVVAVSLYPVAIDALHRRLRVLLEGRSVLQFVAVLLQERLDLGAFRVVGLLAAAHAPRKALRQNAEQRIGEVERVH